MLNNKMSNMVRRYENRTAKNHALHMKLSLLSVALFVTACQTVTPQGEVDPVTNAPLAQSTTMAQAVNDAPITSSYEMPNRTLPPVINQANTAQPEATQKHYKTDGTRLLSNGSIPNINYQNTGLSNLQPLVQGATSDENTKSIQLDYEQVEMRMVLEDIADALNMSIVIDPAISGDVTMRTAPNSSLTQADLFPLLQMILTEADITLEQRNGVYYAKKSKQYLPSAIGTSNILETTDASLVMQVTPLKNISIDTALTVLKPIAGDNSRLLEIPNLNTLLIIDTPEQLKRLNGLLSLIDSDPFKHRSINLYKLAQSDATDVSIELNEILKLIEGNKPAYQVLPLNRINALLVVAPPRRGFKEVSRWVDILDSAANEAIEEQIFIYKCKSLKAISLAETLNAIFEQDNKTVKETQSKTTLKPNEFKTVSKESLSVDAINNAIDMVPKENTSNKASSNRPSANINVTIVADEDSNSLLVRTTAKDYKQLLGTIRTLDVVPMEVLINVVIAQVTLSDSQSFGVDWASLGSSGTTLQTNFGQAQSVSSSGSPLGLIVNRSTSDWRVTLNALAQESDVNILSRPSLLIANNQEGLINIGKEVPVETSSTVNISSSTEDSYNVTQQVSYRTTGIELTVTPQINDDGIVSMEIKQGLSAIEGQTEGSDAGLNPTFTNQEINTSVIVRDKETIILGGLIETTEVMETSGVPLLKDIPYIGYLFKSKANQIERRELILIISTQIVDAEGDYDNLKNSFRSRYNASAKYLDEHLQTSQLK